MNFAIVISKKDEAGVNIAHELDKIGVSCVKVEKESIFSENLDKNLEFDVADFIIFATKHFSQKENRTLTIHAPGNWHKAEFGGKDEKVCSTSALFLKHLFLILTEETEKENEKSNFSYQTSMETTHHGPYLEKPCCFIEIGSTKNQWNDEKAGKVIAKTIQRAVKEKMEKYEPAIGIGGPHYCPNFNKIQSNSKYALGHIISEYALPLTKEMLNEALKKTIEKPMKAILDWKGCGISEERRKIIEMLEKNKIDVIRSDKVMD